MGTVVTKPEIEVDGADLKDPRSPTPDISRTPLHVSDLENCQKITKNVDLMKECFEKYVNNLPINQTLRNTLNQIDPRSPTLEFQRTPLAILIKNPELIAKYNHMNTSDCINSSSASCHDTDDCIHEVLDSCLRNLEKDLSMHEDEKNKEPSKSPNTDTGCISVIEQEVPKKSPIPGLLETNLDYIETDLDTIKRKLKKIKPNMSNSTINCDNVKSEDVKPVSLLHKPTEDEKNVQVTPKMTQPNVEIKNIFNYNLLLQQKRIENKMNCSDLLLIYEDNPTDGTPDVGTKGLLNVVNNQNEHSRTPLACVANIDQANSKPKTTGGKKSLKKMKSRIPIKIKTLDLAAHDPDAPNATCITSKKYKSIVASIENTPPKPRVARWDKDNSVLL